MRNLNKILGTGCFFLCLGGWVCDGQLIRADSEKQANQAAITHAVAAAATPGAEPRREAAQSVDGTAIADGAPPPAPEDRPRAPVRRPAAGGDQSGEGCAAQDTVQGVGSEFRRRQRRRRRDAVDLSCRDIDISMALQALSLQSKRNIIISKEVTITQTKVTANLYNVTFKEAAGRLAQAQRL